MLGEAAADVLGRIMRGKIAAADSVLDGWLGPELDVGPEK
jgi:hypothetical protein